MTIYDTIKDWGRFRRHDGEFGIEIETESINPYNMPVTKFWNPKGDDSLRNFGVEYVLKAPMKYGIELNQALEEFKEVTKNIKFIDNPIGGSVHVHINFLNESFKTLGNFLTTAVYTENLLMEYSGPDRRNNLFCLPVCDAEETVKNICNMFKAIEKKQFQGMMFDKSRTKYANINLSAIQHFGSIEIRSFRGETNIDEIQKWVSILNSILKYSRQNHTPKEFLDRVKEKEHNIIDDIFPNFSHLLKCQGWEQKLNKNLWYAASVAYSVKDWEKLDTPNIPEFAPKVQEIMDAAQRVFKRNLDRLNLDEQDQLIQMLKAEHEAKFLKKAGDPKDKIAKAMNKIIFDDGVDAVPPPVPGWHELDVDLMVNNVLRNR